MIVPAITLRGFSRQRHRSITDLPRLPALSEFCEFVLNLSVASRLSWNRHHYREAGDLMVQLHVERTIAASPERVFDWLADPTNLAASPLVLKAGWAKGSSEPGVGAVREVTGVGVWFREEITAYDAPRSYSYLIVRSFPASNHEGGTLTFTASGDGTHVDWVTSYTIPARAGGKVMEAVSSRLLRSSFLAILAGCAKALES
jgi:hypothetical protein